MKMVTILLTCWLGWLVQPALALERVALVIGNATYPNLEPGDRLKKPPKDASAVTTVLRQPELGFTVFYLENGSRAQMKDAVSQFARRLNSNTMGLFYFSSHGARSNGEEYLLANDFNFKGRDFTVALKEGALEVAREIRDVMQNTGSPDKVLILDACRNNPLDKENSKKGAKAIGIGFGTKDTTASVKGQESSEGQKSSEGFLIIYATAAGDKAMEIETDEFSFYTKHLLKYLPSPVLSLTDIVMRVQGEIIEETKNVQTPWQQGSLSHPIYLAKVRMKATGDVP